MKRLEGTLTEQNLLKAFAGESQARNRYTFFAKVAKTEGYEQIKGIFLETAEQEESHAKRFFEFLQGGMLTITAAYPAGRIGTSTENLLEAAEGERLEWSALYSDAANVAIEEGFKEVATAFKAVASVEEFHEWRYRELLSRLEKGTFFRRESPIKWQCRKCGFIHEGIIPPQNCPACLHPRSYFEPAKSNY